MLDAMCERQRLDLFGELIGGISHELNNALSIVRGHEELLIESLEAPTPQDSQEELLVQARTMYNWTGSVLAIARRLYMGSRRLRDSEGPVDLNALVTEAIDLCRYRCDRDRVLLLADLDAGDLRVTARPGPLQQAIINLIQNAREALVRAGEEGTIRVATSVAGQTLAVTVEDDGPGLAVGEVERVFEVGVSAKEGDGVGLGLPVARRIAERYGGTLRASPDADGVAFVLELPAL